MNPILRHLSQVSEAMTLLDVEQVRRFSDAIRVVKQAGGTMYLFGNGGSHTTASHFSNDLLKMAKVKAVCVGDMTAAMLAYGNDEGWQNMFVAPLRKLLKPTDGVIGISCSGNSRNVIKPLQYALGCGVLATGLTGLLGESIMSNLGLDVLVSVPADDIRVQEDVHLMICHAVTRMLQESE